jgi:glycosyltransferase involved in cell wall biosynthesis
MKKYSFMKFEKVTKKARFDIPEPDKEYDLAIDFNSYQNACAALVDRLKAKKKVMWVHNDVAIKLGGEWKYRVLWHFFKGKFKIFDQFITVSDGLIDSFVEKSGVSREKISFICNYIDVDEIITGCTATPDDFFPDPNKVNLVAVGRLCYQKGYDILLDILSKVCQKRDDLAVYIIGDGEDREALLKQRAKLGLDDKVFFLGNKKNPFCYMNLCDGFVSTSRYEGQPLNIMEAKVLGLKLYIAKNLEKYTGCGIEGIEDMETALLQAEKSEEHQFDRLSDYNKKILDSIEALCAEEVNG